jgi:hypothetical protein
MKEPLQLHDVVALLEDHPEVGLLAGQVGTIVERVEDGVFEIEFSDEDGRTYAELALPERQVIALRYAPVGLEGPGSVKKS